MVLFFVFFGLSKQQYNFSQQINMTNYPCSIHWWVSNSRPLGHEYPSITTRQVSLPQYIISTIAFPSQLCNLLPNGAHYRFFPI